MRSRDDEVTSCFPLGSVTTLRGDVRPIDETNRSGSSSLESDTESDIGQILNEIMKDFIGVHFYQFNSSDSI